MSNEEKEWRGLCELAAVETDHEKLVALADRINRLLEQRENRLRAKNNPDQGDSTGT
jgi:hypothetical protein